MGDGEGQPNGGAIHAAIRAAGRYDFGPAQTVFTGNGRDLVLAADAGGRAALAFADAGANPSGTFLATQRLSVRAPGGSFAAPVALGPGPLYSAPAVTVAGGRVFAAWASQTELATPAVIRATTPQGTVVDLGPGSAPLAAAGSSGPVFAWSGPSSYLGFAF